MEKSEAIKYLEEQLEHALGHLEWEGQDEEYYQEWEKDRDSLMIALEALRPPTMPRLTLTNGQSIYLTQEHIDVLLAFERKQMMEKMVGRFMNSLDEQMINGIPRVPKMHGTFDPETGKWTFTNEEEKE